MSLSPVLSSELPPGWRKGLDQFLPLSGFVQRAVCSGRPFRGRPTGALCAWGSSVNWDALGAIAELTGSFVVLATLVYLARQVRQGKALLEENRKIALGQTYATRTQQRIDLSRDFLQSGLGHVLAQLRDKDWPERKAILSSLSASELEDYSRLRSMQVLIIDNLFLQHQLGILDDEVLDNARAAIRIWGEEWIELGLLSNLRRSFVDEIENILNEVKVGT